METKTREQLVVEYANYIIDNGGFDQGREGDNDARLCQWLEDGSDSLIGTEADMAAALAEWLED